MWRDSECIISDTLILRVIPYISKKFLYCFELLVFVYKHNEGFYAIKQKIFTTFHIASSKPLPRN